MTCLFCRWWYAIDFGPWHRPAKPPEHNCMFHDYGASPSTHPNQED